MIARLALNIFPGTMVAFRNSRGSHNDGKRMGITVVSYRVCVCGDDRPKDGCAVPVRRGLHLTFIEGFGGSGRFFDHA
jgi:hypothetical protein